MTCSALDSTDLIRAPSGSGCGSFGCSPSFLSTPLLQGGHFILASWHSGRRCLAVPLVHPSLGGEEPGMQPLDENLDLWLEADDEGDSKKNQPGGDDCIIDPAELEILQGIVNPGPNDQVLTTPKSVNKQGSAHLNGFGSSDSSNEDMDAKGTQNRKKRATPTKMASNPSQWAEEDIDIVHQFRYKTDLDRFQMYRQNKIMLEDLSTINTMDHSAYIEVARADPSTIMKKSVFSVAAYWEVL